jgi:hypothetical protein
VILLRVLAFTEDWHEDATLPEPSRRSNRLGPCGSGVSVVPGGGSRSSFGDNTTMNLLRLILIPLVPGLFAFSYVWVVDGGGDLFTCVPRFLAGLMADSTQIDASVLRRVLIPGYLLLFVLPIIAYSLRPKPRWLQAIGVLAFSHFITVGGIILQDD